MRIFFGVRCELNELQLCTKIDFWVEYTYCDWIFLTYINHFFYLYFYYITNRFNFVSIIYFF